MMEMERGQKKSPTEEVGLKNYHQRRMEVQVVKRTRHHCDTAFGRALLTLKPFNQVQ
ncbi:MAG: hypothetical protein RPU14_03240 [Candidatus Sedimenticola sp. (ex Thyasira tokunagai)]